VAQEAPGFELLTRKAVGPDDEELAINPRSRSAKLRVARRTEAPAGVVDGAKIGMPMLGGQKRGRK
jgi:16S rRNA (cytosine1402-N4)-methyltransferase